MKNKGTLGRIISLIGIGLMGYDAGRSDKTGEGDATLTMIGLAIGFLGIVIFYTSHKGESDKG